MHEPTVREALRIIDQEFATVTVEGLCECLRVGRQTLYRKFEHHLGEKPGFTIRKTRLVRLCGVLDDHLELTVEDAAVHCGYASASSAARAFHEICGISPRTFQLMAKMRGRHMTSAFNDFV